MEFIIREAAPVDYESLCDLFDAADKLHRDHLAERFQEPKGPARSKELLLGLLADQNMALFVVERAGKLLGLVQAAVKGSSANSYLCASLLRGCRDACGERRFPATRYRAEIDGESSSLGYI